MAKDYYQILGVSKNASETEIRSAFRRLAQQHHPDKGGDPAKFKEVNEAYQILSDPQKRNQYDQFGTTFEQAQTRGGFSGFDGFRDFSTFVDAFNLEDLGEMFSGFGMGDIFGGKTKTRRKKRGRDLEMNLVLEFQEAVFGGEKIIELEKNSRCEHCGGSGNEPGAKIVNCSACQGRGQVTHIQRTILGNFQTSAPCSVCGGEGKKPERLCSRCGGEGIDLVKKQLKIKIPPGIADGEVIKLSGQGEAGQRGAEGGDLYLAIKIKPHSKFKREGDDIHSQVKISFTQASLGDKIEIETLDGPVTMKISAGTRTNTQFRLRGKGVPHLKKWGRGDQIAEVVVDVPEHLTKRQKELLEELKKEGL